MQTARVLTHPALARSRFRELAALPEAQLHLSEACLVIALEEYPALDLDSYLGRIDCWSEAIRERAGKSRDVERLVEEINRFLFGDEGFHGSTDGYYDLRNTFLNDVLDRHAGLPIALSILYLEVSRRLGLEASGVALPGRFLVKVSGVFGEIFIDPFDDGRVLSTAECQEIMNEVFGGGVRLREHHLRTFSRKEILGRVLAHLKAAYIVRHELERAAASVDRILILDDRDSFELRDRGVLAMQMHQYADAIYYLERYLSTVSYADPDEVSRVREQIAYLRAWLQQN